MPDKESTMSPLKITKRNAAYWRVTFDHPPINLLDPEMIMSLQNFIDQLDADRDVKVVVFDSADADYFISHFDILRVQDIPTIPGPTGLPLWFDFVTRLTQSPVISIAAIRGRARGVGVEFMVACDMSFASREKAILGQPEVGIGITPGGGALERLPSLVGRTRALEIVIGSDDFSAEMAERYGWINRAIPDAELDSFVDAFATRISTFEREAIATAKSIINQRSGGAPSGADLLASQDAFREKATMPATQARITTLLKLGLQKRSDVELRFGHYLSDLGKDNV